MPGIKTWSTTAGDNVNANTGRNLDENQLPSTVNDACRGVLADIRTWYEDAEWRDWGHTVTRTGNTTFTIATDVTSIYTVNRQIRCTDSSTLYGYISASSYGAPDTTVTVTLDSGNLSASLASVALGPDPDTKSINSTSVRNAVASNAANTYTVAQTVRIDDATTNDVTTALTVSHTTSGTPANNIGVGVNFEVETAAGNNEVGASIDVVATDTTSTSEDFKLSFKTMKAGAAKTEAAYVGQGWVVGSPPGGDPGAGGINAESIKINNSAVVAGQFGLTTLTSGNTAGATVDIDLTSYTAYINKFLLIHYIRPATNGINFHMTVSTDGGANFDTTVGNYGNTVGASTQRFDLTSGAAFSNSANIGGVIKVWLYNHVNTSRNKYIMTEATFIDGTGASVFQDGGGRYKSANDIDAIRITASSGNVAEIEWTLYGFN